MQVGSGWLSRGPKLRCGSGTGCEGGVSSVRGRREKGEEERNGKKGRGIGDGDDDDHTMQKFAAPIVTHIMPIPPQYTRLVSDPEVAVRLRSDLGPHVDGVYD